MNCMIITSSGLQYEDVKTSEGSMIEIGKNVWVKHKVALSLEKLINEDLLDSHKEHEPIVVKLGEGKLLKGVEEGLLGMRIGGTRRLIIPPHLAFGERGVPGIVPSNAMIFVEINVSTKTPQTTDN